MKRRQLVTIIAGLIICCIFAGCSAPVDTALADKLQTVKESEKDITEEEKEEDPGEKETKKRSKKEADISDEKTDDEVAKADEGTDYKALYQPVFDEILDIIEYGYNIDREYDYASGSLTEHINNGGMNDPLNEVGYRLEDISKDGIPELLIGYDANYLNDGGESYISGIYTIKDGKPHVTYAGSTRGSCRRMDETRFFSDLSGGVSLTVMGVFRLSDDGCDITWDDCYFTDEKEDGSIGFYHNKTGAVDVSSSEEMQNGDEVFNEIMDDLAYNCIRIKWTPIGTRNK